MVAAILALALLQDPSPTLGKTPEQMLAMGYGAWMNFYTGRQGSSTLALSSGAGLYGDALARRNDPLVGRLPAARRDAVRRLRADLLGFGNGAIATGSAVTGGGTMSNIVSNEAYVDAEKTLYELLSGRGGKAAPIRVSAVTRALARMRGAASGRAEALRYAREAEGVSTRLLGYAATRPRRESDLILNFLVRRARVVAEN